MRDLTTKANVMEIQDGVSGDTHEIYYRMPTNKERAAYSAALFERKGKKVKDNTFPTRLKFGRRICTGFKKGTFGVDGKAFASGQTDHDYRADWAELLEEGSPEVFVALAFQVFEGTGTGRGDSAIERVTLDDDDESLGEGEDPLD